MELQLLEIFMLNDHNLSMIGNLRNLSALLIMGILLTLLASTLALSLHLALDPHHHVPEVSYGYNVEFHDHYHDMELAAHTHDAILNANQKKFVRNLRLFQDVIIIAGSQPGMQESRFSSFDHHTFSNLCSTDTDIYTLCALLI